MRQLFSGASVDEAETSRTILSVLNETGELIDPHTAVGVAAARRATLPDPTTPLVVLSTAHPAKFPEAVLAASGQSPVAPHGTGDLAAKPERFDRLPADVETVKSYVRAFAGV
jgi:threonine synthase